MTGCPWAADHVSAFLLPAVFTAKHNAFFAAKSEV